MKIKKLNEMTQEKEFQRVYITQDNDGHWYVIPYQMKEDFSIIYDIDDSDYDKLDEWINKFDKYRTGGDLNLVEFYAKI